MVLSVICFQIHSSSSWCTEQANWQTDAERKQPTTSIGSISAFQSLSHAHKATHVSPAMFVSLVSGDCDALTHRGVAYICKLQLSININLYLLSFAVKHVYVFGMYLAQSPPVQRWLVVSYYSHLSYQTIMWFHCLPVQPCYYHITYNSLEL